MRRSFPYSFGMTARSALGVLSLFLMAISMVYWWGIQSKLTDDVVIALASTAIVSLVPPILVSFLIPSSPAAMLLQRMNLRTLSFPVIVASALYMLWYMFELQWAWWASQPVAQESGLIFQQVIIGMIGFVVVPSLLWAPVSSEELVAYMKQQRMVDEYEQYTRSRIMVLQAQLARAHLLAGKSIAEMTMEEREEFAALLKGIRNGIEESTKEIKDTVDALYRSERAIEEMDIDDGDAIRPSRLFRKNLGDIIALPHDDDDKRSRRRR